MVAHAKRKLLACFEHAAGVRAVKGERVDRLKGVIRNVKLAGFESRNIGRTIGLDAREFGDAVNHPYAYSPDAFREAIALYEGAGIYKDHPGFNYNADGSRTLKPQERSSDDLIGVARNVYVAEDGIYGDLYYLESHPFSQRLIEVAEKCPDKLALSHEAWADAPVLKNGRIVLTKILRVDGIAVTADRPGTTNGLFESQAKERFIVSATVRRLFESLPESNPYRLRVLEALGDEAMAPMGDAATPIPEADVAATSPEDSVKAGFKAMINAVLDDSSLDVPGMRTKLMGLLDAFDAAQAAVGAGGGAGPDADADAGGEGKKPPKEKKEGDEMETAETKAKGGLDAIAVLESTDLLTDAGHVARRPLVEAMARLPDEAARKAFVAALPPPKPVAESTAPAGPLPRSAAAPKSVAETQAKGGDSKPEPYAEPGSFARACRSGVVPASK